MGNWKAPLCDALQPMKQLLQNGEAVTEVQCQLRILVLQKDLVLKCFPLQNGVARLELRVNVGGRMAQRISFLSKYRRPT